MENRQKLFVRILLLIVLFGLQNCSFYSSISEDDIAVSANDFNEIKNIQEDILANINFITDSNGYYSNMFVIESGRFKRVMTSLRSDNYKTIFRLKGEGTLVSMRINKSGTTGFLLEGAEPNVYVNKYWDKMWLYYRVSGRNENVEVDNKYEKTVWTKELDSNWVLVKNKHARYIGG